MELLLNEHRKLTNTAIINKTNKGFLFFKRTIDILGAIIGLCLFLLLAAILGVVYLFSPKDRGPLLYQQVRIGQNHRTFKIYKFRSMVINADQLLHENPALYDTYVENGYKFPAGKDPRITRVGHFIRKTSLDEFPQFWNVLKGDMSLVGPRPIIEEELQEYGDRLELFLSMKPGMTGVWTVSGRSEVPYPERCDLELSYLNRQSVWTDLKIIIRTFIVVLKKEGAH